MFGVVVLPRDPLSPGIRYPDIFLQNSLVSFRIQFRLLRLEGGFSSLAERARLLSAGLMYRDAGIFSKTQ